MKNYHLKTLAFALGFACNAVALAQSLPRNDYIAGKDKIGTDFKAAKTDCAYLSGNPKDICMAEAKGKAKVARAELEASYKPTTKTRYQARVARADAEYAVARERCDDLAGNAKDVCVKEAQAAETSAKADATVWKKSAEANVTANEKSSEARGEASGKVAEARKDATTEKLEAQYGVAKEKCDTYAGEAKDNCLNNAKARYTNP